MTYKEIIKIIKNISLALPDVESFYTGDVYEINKDQSVKYGSVVLTNQEHSFDNINDQFNYNFVLFYIDRLTDDEANRIDVQTAGINALTTIVKTIEDYGCIIDNVRYNVFKERFNDWCSGVYGTFSIQVDDNDCVEEFEIITPEKLKAITINSNGTYKGLFNEVNVNVVDKEFLTETKSIDINENGTYSVEKSDNVDGMSAVEINVQVPERQFTTERKSIDINENGTYSVEKSDSIDGMSAVEINVQVPQPTFTTEELSVTANGTYTPSSDGFSKVSVNVPQPEPNLQTKTISITENGTQTISADNGYDGLQSVSITTNVSGGTTSDKIMLTDGTKFGGTYNFNGTLYDTSAVTDMSDLFYNCANLTSLDVSGWDTSSVTTMKDMFHNCGGLTSLNLSNFDTSKVTTIEQMFYWCKDITSLDLSGWNTSNVTSTVSMFNTCRRLTSLDFSGWDTSNITNIKGMFYNCANLISLDLSNWNLSEVTNISDIFQLCYNITDLNMTNAILPKINLTNWGLSYCDKLTVDSLVSVLNALPQLSSSETFTCTIGSKNLAKLTDTQKSIATNKNWILN